MLYAVAGAVPPSAPTKSGEEEKEDEEAHAEVGAAAVAVDDVDFENETGRDWDAVDDDKEEEEEVYEEKKLEDDISDILSQGNEE